MAKSPLLIAGMHGLGDNLHQRALLRQLMTRHEVWLETSWVSIYHDLIEQGLHVIRRPVALRTQTKNAERERACFSKTPPPPNAQRMRIMYHGSHVMAHPSQTVLGAMCAVAGCDYATADFSLPIPEEWTARHVKNDTGKPLLIYRPLVVRPEWKGSEIRNADPSDYAELIAEIRDTFFILSIADLVPGKEWIAGPQLKADATLHRGELSFEDMAGLFRLADLVFSSSGFAPLLAQAVGTTACVSIVGGYNPSRAQEPPPAMTWTCPFLGIDPVQPVQWSHQHNKRLDLVSAKASLRAFVGHVEPRVSTMEQMFDPPEKVAPLPAPPLPMTQQMIRHQRAALFAQQQALGLKA